MDCEAKHEKCVTLEKIKLAEAQELADTNSEDDVVLAYEKISESIKRLELSKDGALQTLFDNDKDLEYVKEWSAAQKDCIAQFRKQRDHCKQQLDELKNKGREEKLKRDIEDQRRVNYEQAKFREQQQKEVEEAMIRQQQTEEEWFKKKMELQKLSGEINTEGASSKMSQQTVKLQRYTITPFSGDYKDWLRFWNQFSVEVDGSTLPEISKFHYLLELVKDKPRDDIVGLPHSIEGYKEAKRILQENYGKDSKVHRALIKDLESLHTVTSIHKLESIHDFYNKLSRIVRTLTTMDKLASAQSTVYTLMDKLGPVREVLVQKDDDWEEWDLKQLVDNLKKYVDRHPLRGEEKEVKDDRNGSKLNWRNRDKLLFGNGGDGYRRSKCIYCDSPEHPAVKCTKVLSVADRRGIMRQKKACFNCALPGHPASTCRARGCHKCGQKHHTSICQQQDKSSLDGRNNSLMEKGMSSTLQNTSAIHPTLLANVEGKQVRLMIDTGASSSYICTDVITKLGLQPARKEKRCIEQMYGSMTKVVEVYNVTVKSTIGNEFKIDLECINAEKPILTHLPNPNVEQVKRKQPRLRRLNISEEKSTGDTLPVHIMLGVADFQRIKSSEPPILGNQPEKDPGAEFTMLGWTLYGGVRTSDQSDKQFLLNTGQEEFERLCSGDVLGVTDPVDMSSFEHEEFKKQLIQNQDGFYETRLPWKVGHVPLPENKNQSTARLYSVTRKLERIGKLKEYDDVMQDHLGKGVIEPVPVQPTGEIVHYVPHQPVIREQAESTKMRIVYDCSSKPDATTPSLNDCLETGPSLQPLLFDILLRNRFRRYCITGDMVKAFLQIVVQERDRDAQRILWYDDLCNRNILEYRFTRVIFGATPSPYILGATLQKHLEGYQSVYPETVQILRDDTYVDDIQGGGDSKKDVVQFKEEATTILAGAGFQLHKWHSNILSVDTDSNEKEEERTYAKTVVGNPKTNQTKILGIPWDKSNDCMTVSFEPCLNLKSPITKRKMVAAINSVFDILAWSSPVMIIMKVMFSNVCLLKLHWDEILPPDIVQSWGCWINGLRRQSFITVPRSIVTQGGSEFEIHGFSDASKKAVCAAIYTVEYRESTPVNQSLLVAKSRVAPKDTSIPRLELIAAMTLAKLQSNVLRALEVQPIRSVHHWVDSQTVLYWLANKGTWSAFVRNRVKKIKELGDADWLYVPTNSNPSDLGTRGAAPDKLGDLWYKGPDWLQKHDQWPEQPEINETTDVTQELAMKRTLAKQGVERDLEMINNMLAKFTYRRLLRVTAYILRFVRNARNEKLHGPLTTEEVKRAEHIWLKIGQETLKDDGGFTLLTDENGLLRMDGRVIGYNPIFIPRNCTLDRLLVRDIHEGTGHGGVSSTIATTRERFWIPRLRRLAKSVVNGCNTCKKARPKGLNPPTTAPLPTFRTEMTEPFAVTGVDFAGPLLYRANKKSTRKAYVALYTCATTRAVHLKLSKSMEADEFKRGLKEFVARRGTPDKIVSDNAQTFKATKQWLELLTKDTDLFNYLTAQRITWQFNLSRAPWWGGFFERLVGVMKSSLSKVIGRALLTFPELEEVLLDVECFMNNRPLCYQGEEFEKPVITPNLLLRGQPANYLEEDVEAMNDKTAATKRMKYLTVCREHLKKRWLTEYVHALEERHRKVFTDEKGLPKKGSIVLITDNSKIKSKWRIGRVVEVIRGRDGVIRGYKIKTGTGYIIERPLQLVCDLEISGSTDEPVIKDKVDNSSDADTRERPSRKAKTAAIDKMVGITLNEQEED